MKAIKPLQALKKLVKTSGTQSEAADHLGLSRQYVNDLLRGRKPFSEAVIKKMGLKQKTVVFESDNG